MWPLSAFLFFCCCFPWALCPPEPISLLQRRYSWNVRRFGRQMEMERVLFWKKHFEQIRGEPRRGRCAGFFKWRCVRAQRIAQHLSVAVNGENGMWAEQQWGRVNGRKVWCIHMVCLSFQCSFSLKVAQQRRWMKDWSNAEKNFFLCQFFLTYRFLKLRGSHKITIKGRCFPPCTVVSVSQFPLGWMLLAYKSE